VNTVAVKRSVNTVNHSAPREATVDMTLTRSRLPVTRTIGVRLFGAQDPPGGAASERSPHWSTHAIAAASAFALVSIAGYCSSSHARTAAGCCS
jgi:hypothetical protein